MTTGSVKQLPRDHDILAPDGSEVRVLLSLTGGSMAHFRLQPGQVSQAVQHRSVEELWYVLSGAGEMWRRNGEREDIVSLVPGTSLTLPVGTAFQFRSLGDTPLDAVAVTMPPWPGEDEATFVPGRWQANAGV